MKNKTFLFLAGCICMATSPASAQYAGDPHDYVEYLVTADHADRTYQTGEKAVVKVEAYKGGIPLDGVTLHYSVGDEMVLPEPQDSTTFHKGIATIDMGTSRKPGFRECDLRFQVFGKTYKDVVKLAFSPEKIKSYATMPTDFNDFWEKELEKARKIDLDPRLTHLKKYSNDQVDVYLIRLTVGEDGRYFFGYLSKPKDGRKHPVMFKPPGAGPYKRWPETYFATKGFIVLNVDIHGLSPESSQTLIDDVSPEIMGYWNRGIENRDSCYFKEVYAGCSRCIDYLCSLPEWDGEHVVCHDGSQGGALSIVTAALNDKVSHVCAYYPALCDLTGFAHGRAGGWPKYFKNDGKTLADTKMVETLQYYDVVNFARLLKVPGYYAFGYNDDTCSPTSIYSMLNVIKAPKTVHCTYTNAHFNFNETEALAAEWILKQTGLE